MYNVNFALFSVNIFFLSGFSLTNICCDSQHSRERRLDLGERGYPFNSFLSLPPTSEALDISWVVIVVSSPLHIDNSQNRSRNLLFLGTFFLLWFYRCQLVYSSGGGNLQILITVLLFQDAQFLQISQ